MADLPDFSSLGSPIDIAADSAPQAVQSPQAVQTQAAAPDFSAYGHPLAGPTGDMSVDIPRRLGTAGTDALGMALSMPRTLAQGVDWLGSKVGLNVGADNALASVPQPGGGQLFPDAATSREMAYQTTGATEYVPQTMGGRMIQAGLEAAPFALTGGLGAVLPGVAGGATAEAAKEILPDHPILASLGGFALGAHVASGGANAAAKTVGMLTGSAPTTDLYQAYQRQGVPTALAGDVTQSPGLQIAQSVAARMPGGADTIRNAVQDAQDSWQGAAEKAAATLGPAATQQEAGQSLQAASQNWLNDWKTNSAQKWQDFQQSVPPTTPIQVGQFKQALQDVNQNFGGADAIAKTLQPTLAKNLQDALATDISPNGTLPWQSVQAIRTRLGEILEGGQPVADTAQSAIKRLYGGLSDDMRNGAYAAGKPAADAFNAANAYTAFGHNLIEDHLAPILNATNPEQAAQYALAQSRQGGSRLAAINFAMPGQPANLGAAQLRQAAENGSGGLPSLLRKTSPEAQTQLFGPAQGDVNDLNNVAMSMKNTVQRYGNNSGTAGTHAAGMGRLMSAIEMGNAGSEVAGHLGRAAGIAAGLAAPNVIGKVAGAVGANPLLSRIYSTDVSPFSAPSLLSRNSLLQSAMPDRRDLPGGGRLNMLLDTSAREAFGNAPTAPTQ